MEPAVVVAFEHDAARAGVVADGAALIAVIEDRVAVGVGIVGYVANVPDAVAIDILLERVRVPAAVVVAEDRPPAGAGIVVRIAGPVTLVEDAVAVGVLLAGVPDAVLIAVLLAGVRDEGAVVVAVDRLPARAGVVVRFSAVIAVVVYPVVVGVGIAGIPQAVAVDVPLGGIERPGTVVVAVENPVAVDIIVAHVPDAVVIVVFRVYQFKGEAEAETGGYPIARKRFERARPDEDTVVLGDTDLHRRRIGIDFGKQACKIGHHKRNIITIQDVPARYGR